MSLALNKCGRTACQNHFLRRSNKKYCSEFCRNKVAQARGGSTWSRRLFALKLLRFMEKRYPAKLAELKEKL